VRAARSIPDMLGYRVCYLADDIAAQTRSATKVFDVIRAGGIYGQLKIHLDVCLFLGKALAYWVPPHKYVIYYCVICRFGKLP